MEKQDIHKMIDIIVAVCYNTASREEKCINISNNKNVYIIKKHVDKRRKM